MGTSKIRTPFLRILFGFVVVFWMIGSAYVVTLYQYRRFQCQEQFEENKSFVLPDQMVTLIFPRDQVLHWEKVNKELEWKDKLYDVIEITYTTSQLIIRCIEDHAEDAVVRTFRNVFRSRRNQDHDSSFSFQTLKCILPAYHIFKSIEDSEIQEPSFVASYFGLEAKETTSPPPDFMA